MSEYYSVTEYAKMTGKDPSHIRRLLIYGKLVGMKVGKQWVIPKNVKYPEDNRVRSGNCRNWRKRSAIHNNNPVLFRTLRDMCNTMSEIYGDCLDKVILYGSYARGEQTEESDADIAVILRSNITEQMHDSMIDALVEYELECGVTISTVQIDSGHFSEWKTILPYYMNIDKEGIVLWRAA